MLAKLLLDNTYLIVQGIDWTVCFSSGIYNVLRSRHFDDWFIRMSERSIGIYFVSNELLEFLALCESWSAL